MIENEPQTTKRSFIMLIRRYK